MIFKSYGFWTALAGILTMIVSALGKIFGFAIEDGLVNDIVMGVAGLLVLLGVVTIPKGEKKDDEQPGSEDEQKEDEQDKEQDNDEQDKNEQNKENK